MVILSGTPGKYSVLPPQGRVYVNVKILTKIRALNSFSKPYTWRWDFKVLRKGAPITGVGGSRVCSSSTDLNFFGPSVSLTRAADT